MFHNYDGLGSNGTAVVGLIVDKVETLKAVNFSLQGKHSRPVQIQMQSLFHETETRHVGISHWSKTLVPSSN